MELSVVQVLASCAAAVTAAVISSKLGVAGTVAGAAVASVVATVGTAIYAHSVHVTRVRLQTLTVREREAPPNAPSLRLREGMRGRSLPWKAMAAGSVIVFALTAVVVTSVEVLARQRLSSLVGDDSGSRASGRTTIGTIVDPAPRSRNSVPSPSLSPTAAPSADDQSPDATPPTESTLPVPSPSATVSESPSQPLSPSETASESPSPSPSRSPSPSSPSSPSPSPSDSPSSEPATP